MENPFHVGMGNLMIVQPTRCIHEVNLKIYRILVGGIALCLLLSSCTLRIIGYGTDGLNSARPLPETTEVPSSATPPASLAKPQTNVEPPSHETQDAPPVQDSFVGEIPESSPADPSWFDDACFIGDSITEGLRTYALTGALGNAKFFAVRSYSTINALRPLSDGGPHPSYQGVKMTAVDCVAKSGAKKVYIMLGTNDLYNGVDSSVKRYEQLITKILDKSPDVEIFVQSMTPMASTSTYITEMLNNDNIKLYNEKLLQMCEKNGWYFLNVASVMYESSGQSLNSGFCSDKTTMGVHFNTSGYKQWVSYLRTHTVTIGN